MSKQPEALRLADEIEGSVNNPKLYWQGKAAVELRRLHALNAELLEALEGVMYWDNGKPEWGIARTAIAKATGAAS